MAGTQQTFYYEFPDGTVQELVTTDADPQHPADATLLTEEEYNAKRAAIEQAQAQHRADIQAQEAAESQDDYQALLAAGIPDATARRLSGYSPV
ncbi:hypothetical protein [Streptomyces sp. TRM68367]|uniref:hypothetical protein n=1 Tax=Streptomyces sp. TRM68367 TaxID=2758415 RepID=UPI00165A471C|nr:hypothetical protein [Streptomyces sp. TRM68367]MBC9729246.1 hypothetical protein [Streptomyces sp. TRM68367]